MAYERAGKFIDQTIQASIIYPVKTQAHGSVLIKHTEVAFNKLRDGLVQGIVSEPYYYDESGLRSIESISLKKDSASNRKCNFFHRHFFPIR